MGTHGMILYHYIATSYAILCQFHVLLKQTPKPTNRSILYVIKLEFVNLSLFKDAQAKKKLGFKNKKLWKP
jgi:hypothetical protein